MPTCDMRHDCTAPISHIDRKGYVYCTPHGHARAMSQPCRKLTAAERATILDGRPIKAY